MAVVEEAGGDGTDEAEVPEREVHGLPQPARSEECTGQRMLLLRVDQVSPHPPRRGHQGAGEEQVEDGIDVIAQGREPRSGRQAAPEREADHRHAVDLLGGGRAVVRRDHGHRVAARDKGAREKLQAPGGAAGRPWVVVLGGEDELHFASHTAKKPAFSSG